MTARHKAIFQQEITVRIRVNVTGNDTDLGQTQRRDIEDWAAEYVRHLINGRIADSTIRECYANRGPGGSRYWQDDYPEGGTSPMEPGIEVGLDTLRRRVGAVTP